MTNLDAELEAAFRNMDAPKNEAERRAIQELIDLLKLLQKTVAK